MKRVEIVLIVDDVFDDGSVQSSADIFDSITRYFTDQIAELDTEGAWGGLNGAPVYVTRLEMITITPLGH